MRKSYWLPDGTFDYNAQALDMVAALNEQRIGELCDAGEFLTAIENARKIEYPLGIIEALRIVKGYLYRLHADIETEMLALYKQVDAENARMNRGTENEADNGPR